MKSTILVVDDDPILRDIYDVMLGDLYNLYLAASGQEALEYLRYYAKPELILLDIMMPGMNGYEMCKMIRDDVFCSHVKIILVSAKVTVEERIQGYEAGADDYITKPFEEKELLAKINVFLRLKNVEEIDKLKGDFLTLFSHEARTPLNGILGFAQLLQESPTLSEEDKEFVELIITSGESLLRLSEKTILLSDLKSGDIQISKIEINLRELLAGCQQKLIGKAEEKQLLIQVQGDVDVVIDGDQGLLQHAFDMVLDNAVKFAREGTVVEVIFNARGDRIKIDIANEGERILDEDRENIFDEFFVQNLDNHHQGHGLSLAIARRIVQAHDGALSAKNQDKGPVFVFDLQSWHLSQDGKSSEQFDW